MADWFSTHAPGNIDLTNRPQVHNPDGSTSTVLSMSFNEDGKEILVPRISDDGRVLSNQEAIDQYHRTGKHLGIFGSPEEATTYAQQLHQDQASTLGGDWFAQHAPASAPTPVASHGPEQPGGFGSLSGLDPGAKRNLIRGLHGSIDDSRASAVQEHLPEIAGMAAAPFTGGMSLGPALLAQTGAAAAGTGGRALLRLAHGDPQGTLAGNALETAMAGPGAEAGGRAASGVLKLLGKGAYAAGLRPSTQLRRDFQNLLPQGIKEGILTPAAAERAVSSSGQEAKALIASNTGTAPNVTTKEFASEIGPVAKRARVRIKAGLPNETTDIAARFKAIAARNPQGMPLAVAHDTKTELQDLATQVYKARDRGAVVNTLGGETNEAIAKGARKAIEQRVPAIAPVNQRTQALIGVDRAMSDMQIRPQTLGRILTAATGIMGTTAAGPLGGVGSVAAMQALQSPRLQMAAGVGLDRLGDVPIEQLIRALMLAKLTDQSPP